MTTVNLKMCKLNTGTIRICEILRTDSKTFLNTVFTNIHIKFQSIESFFGCLLCPSQFLVLKT